jgi:ABC-2 type transport system permease protein
MSAIFRRELKSYFTSPLGYLVLAMMFAFAGYYFYLYNMAYGMASLSYVFNSLLTYILLLVLPILTMRLLSDDKRQKTDQALLTAPVSLTGIVLGKFFAALVIFTIGISITLVFAVIIAFQVTPDWLQIIGNYLGLLMLGGMIISVGLLISSLTESQLIAALGTFLASMSLLMIDSVGSLFASNSFVTTVVEFLSINARYNNFITGVIRYDDIVFFISMQALFLFLTVRILDRKRWN